MVIAWAWRTFVVALVVVVVRCETGTPAVSREEFDALNKSREEWRQRDCASSKSGSQGVD